MEIEIVIGSKVVTADGEELGIVKSVEGSAFLVNAPRQFDYWLQASLVAASDPEKLELSIEASLVAGYKMDNPNDHNEFRAQVPQEFRPETVRGQMYRG